jgi:pimeloyl-ACP methyl ester carboxylesterase
VTTPPPLDSVQTGHDGPGLLLVHGTGADAVSNWAPLVDAVAGRYRVVAVNLPGAGATPEPDGSLTTDDLAARVVATAHAAGLDRFHIVGHSLGAVLAVAVAARRPDAVLSLVAHAGWVRSGPRERHLFDLWTRLLRADPSLLAGHLVGTAMAPSHLESLGTEGVADLVAGFTAMLDSRILPQLDLDGRVDLTDHLAAVRSPTLVLASAQDYVVPPNHQRQLTDGIPGASYREVPGGHALPFEDPPRFAALIAAFVDSHVGIEQTSGA